MSCKNKACTWNFGGQCTSVEAMESVHECTNKLVEVEGEKK